MEFVVQFHVGILQLDAPGEEPVSDSAFAVQDVVLLVVPFFLLEDGFTDLRGGRCLR